MERLSTRTDKVVVGYDGSAPSQVGLDWAAMVAKRRGVPLLVVTATGGESSGLGLRRTRVLDLKKQQAQEIAEAGVQRAGELTGIAVDYLVVTTDPAVALQELSREAALVVVGHRSRGVLRGALLGSVAFAVMTHAECPVAVVRGELRSLPSPDYSIVVGMDGSAHSYSALSQAADLAVDTGARLRIVVAWSELAPEISDTTYDLDPQGRAQVGERDPWQKSDDASLYDELSQEVVQHAHHMAQSAVEHLATSHPRLSNVETVVGEGRPEDVILDAAADAGLIVVGARGHSGFASLLLGSTSRRVIQEALCAVFVIR